MQSCYLATGLHATIHKINNISVPRMSGCRWRVGIPPGKGQWGMKGICDGAEEEGQEEFQYGWRKNKNN
jgi:hypothetical protein